MNYLDIIFLIIFSVSTLWGLIKGLIRQVFSLAALVLAYLAATFGHPVLADSVLGDIAKKPIRDIISYAIIFIAVFAAVTLIGYFLRRVVEVIKLGMFDRLLGGVFGFARALIFCMIIVLVLVIVLPSDVQILNDSALTPWIIQVTKLAVSIAPQDLRESFEKSKKSLSATLDKEKLDELKKTIESKISDISQAATEAMKQGELESLKENIEDALKSKGVMKMLDNITWFGHASFMVKSGDMVIYIDPWKISKGEPADIILVSHTHYDHLSEKDINKLSKPDTIIVTTSDGAEQLKGKDTRILKPNESLTIKGIKIEGTAAYNIGKRFHPKENQWLGFIVNLPEGRLYYAGDTDLIPRMKELENITIALLPVGGTYTMDAKEAAQAANSFNPKVAIPYHWGDIVGSKEDALEFKQLCKQAVKILEPVD